MYIKDGWEVVNMNPVRQLVKSVFGSVVVVAFQIAFRAEIYVNDVFSFFKNHFWHHHIKTIQKV